ALMVGVQFWYGDRGGSYVHWYLPLLLLIFFRPNLSAARLPDARPKPESPFKTAGRRRSQMLGLGATKPSVAAAVLLLALCGAGLADDKTAKFDPAALGPEMTLLERDAASAEYRAGLVDMLVTDLAAEWKRAVHPDDAVSFARTRGGVDAVSNDPTLKTGFRRREKIVADFLGVMRAEYQRRKLQAPFDKGETADLPSSVGGRRGDSAEVVVVHPNPNCADQWYRFRGPTGQGVIDAVDVPLKWSATEGVAWTTEIPGAGNASPVLWDDRLWTTAATDGGKVRSLICLDRRDGKKLWQVDRTVEKLERSVISKNGYASATPVVDGERVVAFFGNAGLVCTDLDGKFLWHADLGSFDGTHGPGVSPVRYGDLVLLLQDQAPGPSVAAAVDVKTGEVRWRKDRGGAMGWCTPVVYATGGRDELLFTHNQRLYSLDPATGAEWWHADGPTNEPVPSIVVGDGLFFCTSGRNGPTLAIAAGGKGDVTTTHRVWASPRGGPHVPSPVLVGGHLFLINDRGILTCLSTTDGSTKEQRRLPGKFTASPTAVGDKLLLTSEDGDTLVVTADPEMKILHTNRLEQTILASLAYSKGRLYFRTSTAVVCIAGAMEVR
ncbi:MAG: PQQ-binding-like beta-propeller repeat protein, partial [Planctomycetia bacterium]